MIESSQDVIVDLSSPKNDNFCKVVFFSRIRDKFFCLFRTMGLEFSLNINRDNPRSDIAKFQNEIVQRLMKLNTNKC